MKKDGLLSQYSLRFPEGNRLILVLPKLDFGQEKFERLDFKFEAIEDSDFCLTIFPESWTISKANFGNSYFILDTKKFSAKFFKVYFSLR